MLEEKGFYIDTITNLKTEIIKGYTKSSLNSLNERIVAFKNPTPFPMLKHFNPIIGPTLWALWQKNQKNTSVIQMN